jgi:hypothetical protein
MQSAMLARIGMRLVAGVDDWSIERGLQPDFRLEEVGPLADLKARSLAGLA